MQWSLTVCIFFVISRHSRQKATDNLQREVEQLQAKLGAIETAESDQVSVGQNIKDGTILAQILWQKHINKVRFTWFLQVMKNLESHGILHFHFKGLESHGKVYISLKSHIIS